jgi:hypothetical protein
MRYISKHILPAVLLLFILNKGFAQNSLQDNFSVGNFVQLYGEDTLKVYFNCTGTIVNKDCAGYYRVGKRDSIYLGFRGVVSDYDLNNKLYFSGIIINNKLEGSARFYFPSGTVAEEGSYKNNIREGKWQYYYKDGSKEKLYDFRNGEPLILEAYNRKGHATVVNGNGEIHTEFSTDKQCSVFLTSGKVVNGRREGEWPFKNPSASAYISTEVFHEGNFIQGSSSNYIYNNWAKTRLTKYYPNEDLNINQSRIGCPGDNFLEWKYDESSVYSTFYPMLQNKLDSITFPIVDQWLIVGLQISKKNLLAEVNVSSSINDTLLENTLHDKLKQMQNWETAIVNGNRIVSNIYFTILGDSGKLIIIPQYAYEHSGF